MSWILLAATSASANIGVVSWQPTRLVAPRYDATVLQVEEEHLSIVCTEVEGRGACTFHASYKVNNPTDEVAGAQGAFFGLHSEDERVLLDGQPVWVEPNEAVLEAVGARLRDDEKRAWPWRLKKKCGSCSSPLRVHSVELRVQPGATRTIDVHGTFQGGDEPHDELVYLLSPLRSWASSGPVTVQVTTPKAWSVVLGFDEGWIEEPGELVPGDWTQSAADDTATRATTLKGRLPGRLVVRWDGD